MTTQRSIGKKASQYSYRHQGNHYVLYRDGKMLRQPAGKLVSAKQEELAARLVEALEHGEKHTTAQSLLCYHYTYCNYRGFTAKRIREHLGEEMTYEAFLYDDFLTFGQDSPARQAIATYWAENYIEEIKSMNPYQLVAVQVVAYCYHSWLLPLLIIGQVVSETKRRPYPTVKKKFLDKVEAYFSESDDDFDAQDFASYRRRLSKVIDRFVYYFGLK